MQKFYKEHGNNMLIPDLDLDKIHATKVDVEEIQRKIQEAAERKEEKMRMIKYEQEQKEMEGCTFAPQLATKKKKRGTEGEARDINKFLEDQKKYEEQRRLKAIERKERLLMNEASVMNTGPVINSKSKKILEKKQKR